MSTIENPAYSDLKMIKELVYDACGFELTKLTPNKESLEYTACSFELDGRRVEYRTSKITPTKTGQFVTIWKRNKEGITAPFDSSDGIDFIVITSKSNNHIGQFIFPATVLADKGILSLNGKGGKRGIRVYPPWDSVTSKQAEKTQSWQTKYFVSIQNDDQTGLDLARKLIHSHFN
ncbi:MAG: hypothetical protein K0S23_341 [Fluviicola sp.]|jgi:hypothetical protein|uniref:MepB family protein n=1 Tax=Fluviicola sp. TaxID=1917219 RepID=UPI00262125E5|nr:MepB family protein [Fluviicola sp.]MDF3026034.1 hypothetical protein [Fluviicola sp.]